MNTITAAQPLTGYAFPLIAVKYQGPTNARGPRYVATLRRYEGMTDGTQQLARVSVSYNHAATDSDNRMAAAVACWDKYATATDHAPRVMVPIDMWDGSTGYAVVPANIIGGEL